jgi:hypothetical protein
VSNPRPLRLWRHLVFRGHDIHIYRCGFRGRIVYGLAGLGTMAQDYTTRRDADGLTFKVHEEAVGFAKGYVIGLHDAGAIADVSRPQLVLLDGGLASPDPLEEEPACPA